MAKAKKQKVKSIPKKKITLDEYLYGLFDKIYSIIGICEYDTQYRNNNMYFSFIIKSRNEFIVNGVEDSFNYIKLIPKEINLKQYGYIINLDLGKLINNKLLYIEYKVKEYNNTKYKV